MQPAGCQLVTHTHTYTALRRLRVAMLFAVMGLFNLGMPVSGWAQIVTNTYPQNRFYIMPTGYANPGTNWDVLTNCDMLEDPQGDMKTGAWSMANTVSVGYPTNNMCQFMVEDYNGNMVIQDINTGGVSGAFMSDIVLANSPNKMGQPGYQVLVVYVQATNPKSHTGIAYLNIYDVLNVGTPSISLSLRVKPIKLRNACNGFPHIDMWSDTHRLTNGLPTMSDFAIVWSENATGDLKGFFADVNSVPSKFPIPLPDVPPNQYQNIYAPDVACVTSIDPITKLPVKQIELAYGNGVNDILTRVVPTNNFIHTEMQAPPSGSSTWTVTSGPTILAPFAPFAPRIEAMSQDSGKFNSVKWEIAVTGGGGVWGLNNIIPGGMLLSAFGYIAPFNNSLFGGQIFQAACVAAGVGPSIDTTNIGNNQYTAGYYPWGTSWNYSRDINRLTANISPSPYVINDSSQHVSYYWDMNQSLSLANCSNSGKDLFAVWADTFGIVSKLSTSNSGTVWRMIKPRTTQAGAGVYPNPAGSWISMTDNAALSSYDICDATGRVVRKGSTLASGEMINLDGLVHGFHLLHAQRKDGVMSNYKFTIK
ncbi:MAG: T9SS type A sorting domain-containing protein [Bacteroidetes bacterium]|nr:T9SS type A sorting domain-containing protein [Bacteroidota bacterium]